jgi:hypothetical protein
MTINWSRHGGTISKAEYLAQIAWVEGEPGRKTRVLCEVSADSAVTAHGDSVFFDVDPALVERRRPG